MSTCRCCLYSLLLASLPFAATSTHAAEVTLPANTQAGYRTSSFVAPTPVDREIHVIGIYEAESSWDGKIPDDVLNSPDPEAITDWWRENVQHNHPAFPAKVRVEYDEAEPMQPITLVFGSYEPVIWEFEIDENAIVEEIILSGYHQQVAVNVGDVPVRNLSNVNGNGGGSLQYNSMNTWPIGTGGGSSQGFAVGIEDLLDERISSVTTTYQSSEVQITGAPVGAPIANPTIGAGRLTDTSPNPDLIYDPGTGHVAIDYTDLASEFPFGDGSVWWMHLDAARLFVALANNDASFSPNALDVSGDLDDFGLDASMNEHRLGLDWADLNNREGGTINLGEILPAGIQDTAELQNFLAVAHFATDRFSGELDLIVLSDSNGQGVVEPDPVLDDLAARVAAFRVAVADNADSMDKFCSEIASRGFRSEYDFNGDDLVDNQDLTIMLGELSTPEADVNLDGNVDMQDFVILADHYLQVGTWSHGDNDCNGTIHFEDFLTLADNFGGENLAAAVPEPNGLLMLLIGLAATSTLRNKPRVLNVR